MKSLIQFCPELPLSQIAPPPLSTSGGILHNVTTFPILMKWTDGFEGKDIKTDILHLHHSLYVKCFSGFHSLNVIFVFWLVFSRGQATL